MDITKAGTRQTLKIGGDIAWRRETVGNYVGFRRTGQSSGTWWARSRSAETGKQRYQQLGAFDHLPPGEQFSAAATAAKAWFQALDEGLTDDAGDKTVADACRDYADAFRRAGNARKAQDFDGRFRRLVYSDPIARMLLRKLTPRAVKAWRERLVATPALLTRNKSGEKITRPRADATVNRDMAALRAALNAAHEDRMVTSDLAWKTALKPIKKAGRRRDLYLDRDERRRLIEAASDEIRPFLRGLAMLPLRPGALAALTAGDYDHRRKALRIGTDKTDAERRIQLPDAVAHFLREQTKSKLPAAPVFCRGNGKAWVKETWRGPIKDAIRAAGLPGAGSAYTLRHSTISDLVSGGLPLLAVAQVAGTSAAMIESHYGHLAQEQAAKALAGLVL